MVICILKVYTFNAYVFHTIEIKALKISEVSRSSNGQGPIQYLTEIYATISTQYFAFYKLSIL